jgi:hypothetical protein
MTQKVNKIPVNKILRDKIKKIILIKKGLKTKQIAIKRIRPNLT